MVYWASYFKADFKIKEWEMIKLSVKETSIKSAFLLTHRFTDVSINKQIFVSCKLFKNSYSYK